MCDLCVCRCVGSEHENDLPPDDSKRRRNIMEIDSSLPWNCTVVPYMLCTLTLMEGYTSALMCFSLATK